MKTKEHDIKAYRAFRWYCLHKTGTCTICGSQLTNTKTAFIGKDKNGYTQFTCLECKNHLTYPHSAESEIDKSKLKWRLPAPHSHLWRYLDLAKFVSLLSNRELFLTRLDHFSDKYEGAICSEPGLQKFEKRDYFLRKGLAIEELKKEGKNNPTETEVEEKRQLLRLEFDKNRELNRKQTFVCCWTENDCESEAMWRLYSKDIKCGIAIHTTYEKLFNSLNPFDRFDIGGVQYVNYDKDFNEALHSVWYKRKSLEYENEVRVVCENPTNSQIVYDKKLPVKLDTLILEVVTSPEAEPWFVDLIKELCEKYNVSCNVRHSDIQTRVYY